MVWPLLHSARHMRRCRSKQPASRIRHPSTRLLRVRNLLRDEKVFMRHFASLSFHHAEARSSVDLSSSKYYAHGMKPKHDEQIMYVELTASCKKHAVPSLLRCARNCAGGWSTSILATNLSNTGMVLDGWLSARVEQPLPRMCSGTSGAQSYS